MNENRKNKAIVFVNYAKNFEILGLLANSDVLGKPVAFVQDSIFARLQPTNNILHGIP